MKSHSTVLVHRVVAWFVGVHLIGIASCAYAMRVDARGFILSIADCLWLHTHVSGLTLSLWSDCGWCMCLWFVAVLLTLTSVAPLSYGVYAFLATHTRRGILLSCGSGIITATVPIVIIVFTSSSTVSAEKHLVFTVIPYMIALTIVIGVALSLLIGMRCCRCSV